MRRFLTGRMPTSTHAGGDGATGRAGRRKRRSTWVMILTALTVGAMFALFPSVGAALIDSSGSAPSIQSEFADYNPGQTVNLTGANWDTGGTQVHIVVNDAIGQTWQHTADVTPDASGNITDTFTLPTTFIAQYTVDATQQVGSTTLSASSSFTDANPSASLDQCANDPFPSPNTDGCNSSSTSWVNGNLGSSKSSYFEGDSIPYRLTFDNLSTNGTHKVTIEWDTTKGGKHALDYLTTFNRTVANADPCLGVSGCSSPSTFPIPADPQVTGAGVTPVAGNFTLYGGTITAVDAPTTTQDTACTAANRSGSYCYSAGTGFTGDKSASITISFTASVANPVLAWGGHISSRADWGASNSAVAVSGSPYHTRLIDLDGGGGNQDRSLSADAVIFPGSITIVKQTTPDGASQLFNFTTGGTGTPALSPSTFQLSDGQSTTYSNLLVTTTQGLNYTFSESAQAGWTLNGVNPCSATSPNGGSSSFTTPTLSITMQEGENWTCTFNNTRQQGTIELKKAWSGTPGQTTLNIGTSAGGSQTDSQLTGANGTAPLTTGQNTVDTGTYYVSESGGLTHYTSSLACFNDNGAGGGTANNGTKDGSEPTVTPGADNSVSVGNGDHIICTFTNTHDAKLTIDKSTVGGDGTFSFSGANTSTIQTSGGSGTDGGQTFTAGNFGAKTVTETPLAGWSLTNITCDSGSYVIGRITGGNFVNGGTDGFDAGDTSVQVTIAAGDNVTCTFTNKVLPKIVIVKNAKPAQGIFTFDTTGSTSGSGTSWPTGTSAFTLTGSTAGSGNTRTFTVDPGTYTVTEQTQLGWVLTGIGGSGQPAPNQYDCVVTGSGGSTGSGVFQGSLTPLDTRTVSITIKYGDTVTCTFENTGSGATRTQGFWATHPQLANIAWFGGSEFGHTFPGVANVPQIGDRLLCPNGAVPPASPAAKDMGTTIVTQSAALGRLMGGFWSGISTKSTGGKRTSIDQSRMQLVQQLLAAELNASAFGSLPSSGTFSAWESAYCGSSQTAIKNALQQAASFNSQGDSSKFTPGTSADSKGARAMANIPYWDVLP